MKNILLLVLLGFLVASLQTHAQESSNSGQLQVTITDEEGQATPVRVKLMDARGNAAGLPSERNGQQGRL